MVTRIKGVKLNLFLAVMFVSLIGIFIARNLVDQLYYGIDYWMDFIIYFGGVVPPPHILPRG